MQVQSRRTNLSAGRAFPDQPIILKLFRITLSVVLVSAALLFIVTTWRWPLAGDAAFFHYMVSLLRSGQVPYRDFVDVNLPGTYAVQAAVIAALGPGPVAFRLFDLSLLAVVAAAAFVLCRANAPGERWSSPAFPALFTATLFAIIHGRDGVIHQGQRDLVLATLYLVACAFLQATLQRDSKTALHWRSSLWPSLLSGLILGFACTIKPLALLLLLPLSLVLILELRSQKRAWLLPLATYTAAALVGPTMVLIYLARNHALIAFWQALTRLMPYHASLARLSTSTLVTGSISSVCLPLFLIWLAVFVSQRRYALPLDRLLLVGFLAGIISYVLQGRGYPYHRYPSEVFLLVLAAIAFCDALWPVPGRQRATPWVQFAAAAGLSLGTLYLVPRSLQMILRFDLRDQYTADLRAALNTQGGSALNNRIQCLDGYSGCLNTLQQMHLIEATGFLYDCYLYSEPDVSATRFLDERNSYRTSFRKALLEHPPELFIVSSQTCGGPVDYLYVKLTRWPWLQEYLNTQYQLVEDHVPSDQVRWGGKPQPPLGFRIYRRNP